MPAKTSTSGLAARLGPEAVKAWEEHKDEPVKFGAGGGLPPGIENGIAHVTECRVGQYKEGDNKGKDFFIAVGIVKEPATVNVNGSDIPIQGQRTQIGPMPLCAYTKGDGKGGRVQVSVGEAFAAVQNQVKALGISGEGLHPANIEASMAAIVQGQVHTRFRTWAADREDIREIGGKWYCGTKKSTMRKGPFKSKEEAERLNPYAGTDPKVNNDWRGACEFNGQVQDDVQDNSGSVPDDGEVAADNVDQTADEVDLDALAVQAVGDENDPATEAAGTKLREMASASGKTEEEIDASESWDEVVSWIRGDSEPAAAEEPWEAKAGEVCLYKPIDAKTKKPVKKAVDVEIVSVDKKAKTVVLKNLVNTKVSYKNVPISSLEHA